MHFGLAVTVGCKPSLLSGPNDPQYKPLSPKIFGHLGLSADLYSPITNRFSLANGRLDRLVIV